LPCLLVGLEHDEREAAAVDGFDPIAGDEAGSGTDLGQDLTGERVGCRRRLLGVDCQRYECCVDGPLLSYSLDR
jgi:hypothetical protein